MAERSHRRIASVAVIGGGIAGLACATALARAGVRVSLFDKGRRPGGRVATRHVEGIAFNHGAQFATARGARFGALLAALRQQGRAATWARAGGAGQRVAFVPDMAELPAALAEQAATLGVQRFQARHAACVHRMPHGYAVRHLSPAEIRPGGITDHGGALSERHDAVVLALPPSQAQALLATLDHPFAASVSAAQLAPCWAVMARFERPVPGADVIEDKAGILAWAAREGSRPATTSGAATRSAQAWTLHAGAAWSRAHLDETPQAAGDALLEVFRATTGAGAADLVIAHRWLYALVEQPIGRPHLWDAEQAVGVCGDWLLGGRIEAAYDSGLSLADALAGVDDGPA